MDNALYVGLSRQMTLRRALEIAGNNIANLDTAGFKVEQPLVNTNPATPAVAGADPINFVLDKGVARDFGQGGLEETGNPLDVAIEGDGFFTIKTANGDRYTRDGRFTTNAQNQIVTKDGQAVLDASGREITLNPTGPAPTIARDGTISQGAAQLGKLGVARFTDLSVLSKEGDNLFSAPAGTTPVAAPDALRRQGMLERSNTQPILEITRLIEITRTYERVAQMMDQAQELQRNSIDRLGRSAA